MFVFYGILIPLGLIDVCYELFISVKISNKIYTTKERGGWGGVGLTLKKEKN